MKVNAEMTRRGLLLVSLFSMVLPGCSDSAPDKPELGSVKGVVSLDGQPLAGVSIYFKPSVGRQSIATTDDQGNYEAMYMIDEAGVKVGECSVTLEWGPDGSGPAIPPKYGANSELKLTVKQGENTYDIAMTSK